MFYVKNLWQQSCSIFLNVWYFIWPYACISAIHASRTIYIYKLSLYGCIIRSVPRFVSGVYTKGRRKPGLLHLYLSWCSVSNWLKMWLLVSILEMFITFRNVWNKQNNINFWNLIIIDIMTLLIHARRPRLPCDVASTLRTVCCPVASNYVTIKLFTGTNRRRPPTVTVMAGTS